MVGLYTILRLWPSASEPAEHLVAFVALLVVAAFTAIGVLSVLSLLTHMFLTSSLADPLSQTFVKWVTHFVEARLFPLLAKLLPAAAHAKAFSLAGLLGTLIFAQDPVPERLVKAALHLERAYYHTADLVAGSFVKVFVGLEPREAPELDTVVASLTALQVSVSADWQIEKEDRQREREALESIVRAAARGPVIIQTEPPRPDTTAVELRHELGELRATLDHILLEVGKRQGSDERSSQVDAFLGWVLMRMEPPSLSPLSSNLESVANRLEALQSVAERGVALSEERDRRTLPQRVRHLVGDSGSLNRLPVDTLPGDFDLYYHATLLGTGLQPDGARYVRLRTDDSPTSVWHRWQRSPNNDEWCLQKVEGKTGHRRFLKSVQGPNHQLVTHTIDAWVETGADGLTEICLEFEPKSLAPIANPQGCRHQPTEPPPGIRRVSVNKSGSSGGLPGQ